MIQYLSKENVSLYFIAAGNRTLRATPDDIEMAFYLYEAAENQRKYGYIPEDRAKIYVTYNDDFLLVSGITKNNNLIITEKYPMNDYIIGTQKVQNFMRERLEYE